MNATIRSAGARLARQPWMRAAFHLDRRMMHCGGRRHWPDDLRSAGREWLQLCLALNSFGDWPTEACRAIQAAKTYPEAIDGLREILLSASERMR